MKRTIMAVIAIVVFSSAVMAQSGKNPLPHKKSSGGTVKLKARFVLTDSAYVTSLPSQPWTLTVINLDSTATVKVGIENDTTRYKLVYIRPLTTRELPSIGRFFRIISTDTTNVMWDVQ